MIHLFLIPLCIAFVPWLLVRYVFVAESTKQLPYARGAAYLWLAALLWIAAFFVPNIPISSETTTFGQHFMGGAVATALLLYVVKVYKVRYRYWWQPWLAVYFFASGLGVVNELFELLVTASGYMWIDGSDVWWDLLANTAGAWMAYAIAHGVELLYKNKPLP